MKIMFDYQIFSSQEYGGVSRYHVELAKELNRINDTPVNISCKYFINEYLQNYNGKKKLNKINNRYLRKIRSIVIKFINCLHCKKDVKDSDIVHITWIDPYLNKKAKGKLVVTIHDMIQEIFWGDRPEAQKEIIRKKAAIYNSNAIIAISQNTKKDILRIYPDIPEDKITVVYHGTNHLPQPVIPNEPLPNKYILYVGRRFEYKGSRFLAESVADLLIMHKDIKLLFIGGGKFEKKEQELFKSLNIEDYVLQMNATDAELAYIYNHAICFVYPSLYEGFGFPILESFDNNCPCICTNASCLPEIGGDAALYFEAENQHDLAKQIELMINDIHLRQEYINKGKNRVKKFTWDKCANETFRVYEKLFIK